MALPTFFIIGAPKAGTTSLHLYLDQHPQIQMSANKEPRFFAGPDRGVPYAPGRVESLGEYEALFDADLQVRGESSTDYATHPRRQGAPQRIKALVPDARFVYLVRDPLARTISHYRMRVAFLGERRSLAEALGDFSDPSSPYVWPSLYASQLERYLEHFDAERIMVVDQSDLLNDRQSTLRSIFEFLSVSSEVSSTRFSEVLSSSESWRAYPPAYARVLELLSPVKGWVPQVARRSLRRSLDHLWPALERAPLQGETHERLRALYRDEAERLRGMTGRQFSTWSV